MDKVSMCGVFTGIIENTVPVYFKVFITFLKYSIL
jgi:hypothetical protein